jgi:crossover junction endodeoxyribonuclease RuvC
VIVDHVIGIDPGKTGAVARFTPATGAVLVLDMPVLVITKNRRTMNAIDHRALAELVHGMVGLAAPNTAGFVEEVSSRPGQGVVSVFDFGVSSGAARQALASVWLHSVTTVRPQAWKGAVGLPVGASKDASRELVATRFPQMAATVKRKKDDGRAEAILIALYGAITLGLL